MKIWIKILIGILLSFMCLFTCVGYANLTGFLSVEGIVEVELPKELFIMSVTVSNTNGASATVNNFTSTVVNSRTDLGARGNATATYTITVLNNTDTAYGYSGMIYSTGEGTYDNTNIKTSTALALRTPVEPGKMMSFDVTVSYINTSSISNTVLNSVITYKFLPLDEIPETEDELIVSGVLDQFEDILNNNHATDPKSYETLINQMNDNTNNDRPTDNGKTYIGNVADASQQDKDTLETLFQGQLSLNINGEDMPVTTIIKRENIDGGSDDEMVIYMTTDDLQYNLWNHRTAEVYAAVFKNITLGDGTTRWVEQGDMYLGTASITNYAGIPGSGSFNTDRWQTQNQTFTVTSNYSYRINSGTSIDDLIKQTDENANNELRRLLNIAHSIVNDGRYIGANVDQLKSTLEVSNSYFKYENGTYTIISGATRAQLVPIIKQLDSIISQIDIIE